METVAIYIPTLHGGGAEKMLVRLSGGLSSRGYTVDLVVGDRSGELVGRIPHGVNLVDLKAGRIAKSLIPLVGYLRANEPDCLLSTMNAANVVAIVAGHLSGTETGLVARMPNTDFASAEVVVGRKDRLVYRILPSVYRYADRIVAISEGAKRETVAYISGLDAANVTVIYNPVISDNDFEMMSEPVSHSWFDGKSDVIVAAGRLSEEKDFETLLRAYERVGSQRDVRLVILGEGSKRPELESLAEELEIGDTVDMPGFVDNPYKYMAHADVFAMSSVSEGFGNVLVEAMACGTTVVSTDCPHGPGEILEDGRYGLLVPVGSPSALASGLNWALDNPLAASTLEKRATDFTLEAAVDEYVDVLETAASM